MGKLRLAPDYPKPLAAKPLPLHLPTHDVIDLPKMVQVVCCFQADELLDRSPSAYLLESVALHPPCLSGMCPH
jgi:hypothetical protein